MPTWKRRLVIKWLRRLSDRFRKAPVEVEVEVEVVDVMRQARALSRQEKRDLVLAAGWRRVRFADRKSELWENGDGHVCSLFLAAVDALKDEVTTR
jgi:hypothetical protein